MHYNEVKHSLNSSEVGEAKKNYSRACKSSEQL
jgi:hypothetical protein